MISLKNLIEDNDSTYGRWFDIFIQVLIVVSIITFSLETLPDLNEWQRNFLDTVNTTTVIIFTIEYVLRIIVADNKRKFIFSFYGIVDLLAILPFYISTGVDLRSLRALRLLRTIRILKLVRYSKAVQRFRIVLAMIKEELILFFFLCLALFFLSAVGIYYFERDAQPEVFASIFHSLWWAVITLTTVGYGDFYPITVGGRIFTYFVLMIGLGFIAIPTGLIASAMSKVREMAADDYGDS